jgi:hypothetical protein
MYRDAHCSVIRDSEILKDFLIMLPMIPKIASRFSYQGFVALRDSEPLIPKTLRDSVIPVRKNSVISLRVEKPFGFSHRGSKPGSAGRTSEVENPYGIFVTGISKPRGFRTPGSEILMGDHQPDNTFYSRGL